MIAIINTGLGNIQSVANAFEYLGFQVQITDQPASMENASHLVLPGVGAFEEGMMRLRDAQLDRFLKREVLERKKPFLGVCLGMQLLSSVSEEGGRHRGLGWIPGCVTRLSSDYLRIPHVGWNEVEPAAPSRLFEGLSGPFNFYFVHSYHFEPELNSDQAGVCYYGNRFTAAVERDNIFGVQFHPEKSHQDGLSLLKNFVVRTQPVL